MGLQTIVSGLMFLVDGRVMLLPRSLAGPH
ncbi:hypothetical protein ATK36_0745 [Amycolatopsis sulphurea]|uniref:Uncharacterized protein n=1 Tax=Amycolatopsis sulphurea TaxID=76022 RepID=A0A2A9G2Q3_9PSEU|nr:hypothetical protein ATK36_0745 [Amycolatopsis sulphurea]